jgi:hypothetical protein
LASTSLNNTISDCRQCHAPVDANPQILRMQENTPPFTHWLSQDSDGGRSLYTDFHTAHPDGEDYGPIPSALVDKSDPAKMAHMIELAGFGQQPNAFPSQNVESELKIQGWSPSWVSIYDASVNGQFIAAPYHDVKVTDPTKLAAMSKAYRGWLANGTAIPDIRDTFFDDGLRDMGFAPKKGLDGRALLVQMCQQCHNGNLDMTITREQFLVDALDLMSRAEKDLAIQRLQKPDDTRLAMPPVLFRTITDAERQAMIDELKK